MWAGMGRCGQAHHRQVCTSMGKCGQPGHEQSWAGVSRYRKPWAGKAWAGLERQSQENTSLGHYGQAGQTRHRQAWKAQAGVDRCEQVWAGWASVISIPKVCFLSMKSPSLPTSLAGPSLLCTCRSTLSSFIQSSNLPEALCMPGTAPATGNTTINEAHE